MASVRITAVLLVVALWGPSAGALICELACGAKHEQASSDCHQSSESGSTAAIAATDPCHELAATRESILTIASQGDTRAVLVSVELPGHTRSSSLPLNVVSSSGSPHAHLRC